ncbi:MAG: glycosyltransferase family 4 protein [Acidobacteriaceae bacterium]
MKIVQLYNEQRSEFGGESTAIANTTAVLKARGHEVALAVRSSRDIGDSLICKAHAALSGVYSFSAESAIRDIVERERPDVIHAHGVYPLWSPSIFRACRRLRVPTVLHVHCHYLTCPNWYHLREGKVCTLCFGGKEHWCVLKNCRGSYMESAAYALRSAVARSFRLFSDNVGVFIAVSAYLRERLIAGGFPGGRIQVISNVVPADSGIGADANGARDYIAYCGRLSEEKGVRVLLEAARCTGLPVKIAGDGPLRDALQAAAPSNVSFLGYLKRDALTHFYRNARFTVVPSLSFEGLPLAAAESMMHGRPVIGSRIGAIPEVVREGTTGLLFPPGDHEQLASSMADLWSDAVSCDRYGRAAQFYARQEYSEDLYYARLRTAYDDAARVLLTGQPEHDPLLGVSN